MTRTPPIYTVRWSSQISRLNNRLGPPTPAPNAVSSAKMISDSPISHIHIVAVLVSYLFNEILQLKFNENMCSSVVLVLVNSGIIHSI